MKEGFPILFVFPCSGVLKSLQRYYLLCGSLLAGQKTPKAGACVLQIQRGWRLAVGGTKLPGWPDGVGVES